MGQRIAPLFKEVVQLLCFSWKTDPTMDRSTDLKLRGMTSLMHDSALGYHVAGHHVESIELRHFLQELSTSRAGEVGKYILLLSGNDIRHRLGGSLFGSLHRGWIAARGVLFSTDDANVLSECQRGESYLIGRMDDVIKEVPMTTALRSGLQERREHLMEDLMALRAMDQRISDVGNGI